MNNEVVVEEPGKLLMVNVKIPGYSPQHEWGFSVGRVREAVAGIFAPDFSYSFFRTTFNPEVINYLAELAQPKEFSLLKKHGLKDLYLEVLNRLTKREKITCSFFPLVQNRGVHDIDRHQDYVFWPTIHMVRQEHTESFKKILRGLNSDQVYSFIKAIEAPQNYNLRSVNAVRNKGLEPLILDSRSWEGVQAGQLKNAIDFLCQFEYTHDFRDNSLED